MSAPTRDSVAAGMVIINTIGRAAKPLDEQQRLLLQGALAVVLEKAVADTRMTCEVATKQALEHAVEAEREAILALLYERGVLSPDGAVAQEIAARGTPGAGRAREPA